MRNTSIVTATPMRIQELIKYLEKLVKDDPLRAWYETNLYRDGGITIIKVDDDSETMMFD